MRPVENVVAGQPDGDAPVELTRLVDDYRPQPPVVCWGLTTTPDGRWALLVTVPAATEVPLEEVERTAGGFPVVYQVEPAEPLRPFRG